MGIQIIRNPVSREVLDDLAREFYEDIIKGVVDIQQEVIALGGEMHSDGEALLLQEGSRQSDIWGFNILLGKPRDEALLFESFVNIRPRHGNKSLEVKDPGIQERMRAVIFAKIPL